MSHDPQSPVPARSSQQYAPTPPAPAGAVFVQPSPGAPPVPVGQVAPYPGAPTAPYGESAATPTPSPSLGLAALVLALVGVVVSIVLSAATGLAAAEGAVRHASGFASDELQYMSEQELLGLLTPVRGLVLWAEVGYWIGTVSGLAALGLGIAAIVTRRGRGRGIAAVVVAGAAPLVYGVIVGLCILAGIGAGAS